MHHAYIVKKLTAFALLLDEEEDNKRLSEEKKKKWGKQLTEKQKIRR